MDFSRLRPAEAVGALSSVALVIGLFLPWYSLDVAGVNRPLEDPDVWVCGAPETSCNAFGAFTILEFLLLAAASAPLILAWIVIRGHQLSWPPGELTMVVGFTATVLIAYNGFDKPAERAFGITVDVGYWLALVAAIAMAAAGFWRSVEARGKIERKAPGTV